MRYCGGGIGHIGEMYRESYKTNSEETMDVDSDVEEELNSLGPNPSHSEEEGDEECVRGISRQNFSSDEGSDRSEFGSVWDNWSDDNSDDEFEVWNETESDSDDCDLGPEDGEISDDDNNFICF